MHLKTRSVKSGDSLGRRLIDAREKLGCSRKRLSRKYFLSLSFVTAIEQGEYDALPEYMYTRVQLKKYIKILKLSEKEHSALFQEEYTHWKNLTHKQLVSHSTPPLAGSFISFQLTPSFWQKSIIIGAGFLFVAYIGIQVDAAIAPTNIDIIHPNDRLTTEERSTEVIGKTDIEATVTINDQVVQVDSDGTFSERVNLQTGLNTLEITATKKYKPSHTVTRHIIVTE